MTKPTLGKLFTVLRWSIAIAGVAYVLDKLSWQEIAMMVGQADPVYLLGAVLIFPTTFLITGIRWHWLMGMVGIRMSRTKAFILNMVGAFYSTFMPGSTGGDVIKAYYASKFTTRRIHAVMSVIFDRVVGLVALIILGGVMAAWQYQIPECREVAIICGIIVLSTILGLAVLCNSTLRRVMGLDFIISRLPMQEQVQTALAAVELYRQKPWRLISTVVMTFPVHITVIISAMFVGTAFNLPLPLMYYGAAVPVIVLAGSIPISPQGAGVMEILALQLTQVYGTSAGQAVAWTMCIRLTQMLWNLTGGLFVLLGNYHPPKEREHVETATGDSASSVPARARAASMTGSKRT
jgi:glycosyltransferase 2 family protein